MFNYAWLVLALPAPRVVWLMLPAGAPTEATIVELRGLLAPGDVIVVATGVSNGDLLRGVRFLADSARTHSLIMCMRCNWVRFTDGIHFFARERREEVRLMI